MTTPLFSFCGRLRLTVKHGKAARLAAALSLVLLTNGCAVLTKSQVKEVAAFAQVTKNYGTLPGEPIRVYGEVNALDRLINVSARDFQDPDARMTGWQEITNAVEFQAAFDKTAAQADQALSILDTYAELLTTLSSDQFTDALDKSAKSLGKSLDKDLKVYNESFRVPAGKLPMQSFGAIVGGTVRAAGGVFIRNRQAIYLRSHVAHADPIISGLTADMQEMLRDLAPKLATLEKRLSDDFRALAASSKRLPLSTIESCFEGVEKLRIAQQLAEAAGDSASQYSAAHTKLKEALQKRQTLKARLAEIEALADEIKKAKKLAKKLEG